MKKSLVLISLTLVFLTSCAKKQGPLQPPVIPVEVSKIRPRTIPYYIDTLGHFVAYQSVTIQAQVQGELTGLYFEEGQVVEPGELLFTIDKRPYQAVLDKAVATLKQNEATLAYTKSRQERYSSLVEEDFVSKLQYTQYVTELESQEAIVQENRAEIDSAAINVGFCTLKSPIRGVAGKRLIDVGNIITDVGTKMLVVNQIAPLFIDFSIPERHFEMVHHKQMEHPLDIQIFLPNTDVVTHATLQMLDNAINPDTGMIALRGILPNEDHFFWPQQFVRIRLIVDDIENAITVPPSAIVSTSSGEIVWIIDEKGSARMQKVKIGEEYEGQVRILKGVKKGDLVVTKGQVKLREGAKVSIVEPKKESCS